MKLGALVFPALALASCASAAERPPHLAGRCDARPAQQFLGRFGSSEIAAEARAAAGAHTIRWLWPDATVTQEYDPGRLNLELSRSRTIHRIRCG